MTSSSDDAATWTPGSVVPGTVYRIVRLLGQGGMGEVYEVEHELLGTRRALKVLAADFTRREDLAERLRVEARGLARLKHPNLVEVYDLGTASDGRIFFVMELLSGCTLRELQRQRGRLSPRHAVRLIAQVLDGLHAAHQSQLIHRDIKPENIFVCRGEIAKLLDFGVAKTIDTWVPAQQLTDVGMTVGTPRYMAPEQAEGRKVDERTDIYAAGLVLWEALAGRPAFADNDPVELAVSKLTKGVPALQQTAEGIPESLTLAVMQASQRDPAKRQTTAALLALQIRRAVGESEQPTSGARRSDSSTDDTVAGELIVPPSVRTRDRPTAPDRGLSGSPTAVLPGRQTASSASDSFDVADEVATARPTQQLESAFGLDPDCATRTSVERAAQVQGPTGTQMLPAVAAQHCPTVAVQTTPHRIDAAAIHEDRVETQQSPGPALAAQARPGIRAQSLTADAHATDVDRASRRRDRLTLVAAIAISLAIVAMIGRIVLRDDGRVSGVGSGAAPAWSPSGVIAQQLQSSAAASASASGPSAAVLTSEGASDSGKPTGRVSTKPPATKKATWPASGL